jgi:septum formation protein
VDENIDEKLTPAQNVELLSLRKASAVAQELSRGIVIGADTVVVKNGRILGKPNSRLHAAEMLKFLSGGSHEVWTGVAVINAADGRKQVFSERTEVILKDLTGEEIEDYINTGEPMDKAGAYAAQGIGCVLVKGIRGCFFNVVGLPVYRLAEVLKTFEVRVF